MAVIKRLRADRGRPLLIPSLAIATSGANSSTMAVVDGFVSSMWMRIRIALPLTLLALALLTLKAMDRFLRPLPLMSSRIRKAGSRVVPQGVRLVLVERMSPGMPMPRMMELGAHGPRAVAPSKT